LGDIKNSKQK
jgi:hypothetical protein